MRQDSSKYAKALLSLLKGKQEKEKALEKLKSATLLQKIMVNPSIDPKEKEDLLLKWLGKDPFLRSFFMTLLKRRRWELLQDIIKSFESLNRKEEGILEAIIASAIPLDHETLKIVEKKLNALFSDGKVEIVEKVDPSLVGGIVIEVGSLRYDGSVKGRLLKLEEKLTRGKDAY